MFEIDALKNLGIGVALGGGAGFLLHKKLKISKGLGIGLGGVLGLIIAYQMMGKIKEKNRKLGGSNEEKLQVEGLKKRLECMKEHNIGQMVDFSKMSKEQVISATLENEKNAQKYGALCDSYMVKG